MIASELIIPTVGLCIAAASLSLGKKEKHLANISRTSALRRDLSEYCFGLNLESARDLTAINQAKISGLFYDFCGKHGDPKCIYQAATSQRPDEIYRLSRVSNKVQWRCEKNPYSLKTSNRLGIALMFGKAILAILITLLILIAGISLLFSFDSDDIGIVFDYIFEAKTGSFSQLPNIAKFAIDVLYIIIIEYIMIVYGSRLVEALAKDFDDILALKRIKV